MDWNYIENMLVTSDYKGKKVKGEIVSMLREKIEQLQSENDELRDRYNADADEVRFR